MNTVFVSLGSNLGDSVQLLKDALSLIEKQAGTIKSASSVYESEPWGFNAPNNFLNQVVLFETSIIPSDLLGVLQRIELSLGRVKLDRQGYDSRAMDIDILFYNSLIIDNPGLTIPHPRLHLRRFALLPMVEIAPDFVHPVFNKTVSQLLDECGDNGKVRKLF
ncbi:MAG: 2-amino-4-hydroxy-6-hydroxymethyldihydropteridine diphosphokinase [Prevotellaceae bacterium]|jgi:2-amino-4-hydroxy-6-hydroxymethyldihydropteridine diphosphokinase|nr:2-amino-4-hydroxy-6-hydroxymethyldihydropteridine diphosphokinase [Prevotellaceae bacterium]